MVGTKNLANAKFEVRVAQLEVDCSEARVKEWGIQETGERMACLQPNGLEEGPSRDESVKKCGTRGATTWEGPAPLAAHVSTEVIWRDRVWWGSGWAGRLRRGPAGCQPAMAKEAFRVRGKRDVIKAMDDGDVWWGRGHGMGNRGWAIMGWRGSSQPCLTWEIGVCTRGAAGDVNTWARHEHLAPALLWRGAGRHRRRRGPKVHQRLQLHHQLGGGGPGPRVGAEAAQHEVSHLLRG